MNHHHRARLYQLQADRSELEAQEERAGTFWELRSIQRKIEHIDHQISWIQNCGRAIG